MFWLTDLADFADFNFQRSCFDFIKVFLSFMRGENYTLNKG